MASIIGGLLPNGKQQFFDPATGAPAAGGSVTFYVPGTTTAKATYQDSALSILNSNPVVLDGYGMASIWGVGQYRQILQNALGVQIWDQVVGNNALALSAPDTGTTNAYAASLGGVPSLSLVQGVPIYLTVANTNTGASTFNLNGLGAVTLLSASGGTLGAGALVAGSIVPLIYNGTAFQMVAAISAATGATVPIGAILPYSGPSISAPFYLCYGQAVSRSTYSALFSAIGTVWGAGDGSTTFNLPDLRGRSLFGADAMGGAAAGRLTSASIGAAAVIGVSGGHEDLQYHGHALNDPGHQHTETSVQGVRAGGTGNYWNVLCDGTTASSGGAGTNPGFTSTAGIAAAGTGITINPTGGGTSQNVPPAAVVNWIIYAGV
jgi:microcystin-dependent protein